MKTFVTMLKEECLVDTFFLMFNWVIQFVFIIVALYYI